MNLIGIEFSIYFGEEEITDLCGFCTVPKEPKWNFSDYKDQQYYPYMRSSFFRNRNQQLFLLGGINQTFKSLFPQRQTLTQEHDYGITIRQINCKYLYQQATFHGFGWLNIQPNSTTSRH